MNRSGLASVFVIRCLILVLIGTMQFAKAAQSSAAPPDFREVYDLIRTNVAGLSEEDLNRAAVRALVQSLAPKVCPASSDSEQGTAKPGILKYEIYDGPIGYIRIGQLSGEIAAAVRKWFEQANRTNALKGLVVDLRYASGIEYEAAAALAALFAQKSAPLLDWGDGLRRAEVPGKTITVPTAVLVNAETRHAPEAFAATIRELGAALILGSRTAGAAMAYNDVTLSNGDVLRVAVAPVRLGNGQPVSTDGVVPDIRIDVDRKHERIYYDDPFAWLPRTNLLAGSSSAQGSSTNRVARRARYGEAELVRERSDVLRLDEEEAERASVPEAPVVNDPALARALDVLKGLAVIRGSNR